MLTKTCLRLLSILLLALLAACGAQPEEPESEPEPTAVAVEQAVEPTLVPTAIPATATMTPTSEPTQTPTTEPTIEPTITLTAEPAIEPTEVVEAEGDDSREGQSVGSGQAGNASPPSRFQTFTMELLTEDELPFETMEMIISYAITPVNSSEIEFMVFTLEAAMITDPVAISLDMSIEADGPGQDVEELESISATQVDGTMYMSLGEMGCIPFPAEEVDLSEFTSVAGTPSADELALEQELVLIEEGVLIRNYVTDHYRVIANNLELEDATYERLQIDYYQVQGDDLVVRMVMDADGVVQADSGDVDPAFDQIDLTMTLDIISVDKPLEITVPEGCDLATVVPFPIMPDAEQVLNFAGIHSYVTKGEIEQIARFYREEMALLGWNEVTDESVLDIAGAYMSLTFENEDGEIVEIVAAPNADGEGFQVIIMSGGGP